MEWFKKCLLEKYADFSGRARRQEYWMFTLFNIIAVVALSVIGSILDAVFGSDGVFAMIIVGIYYLGIIVPSLAVSVRRLHDTDRSGWWLLLALVPFGGLVIFVFTVLEGTNGPNRFGPSPK
ncbi:DUF805 domain-containing protein [Budvicia diplopodorum]|uniref:DUF805 domain-containing protein n=1 Tax=Budvicia diplopodorum TaxID=1119056 RepID=UPI001356FCF1|nr:DUF805 domain-containing protein [Budvicia diplopodorum]